MVNRKGRIISSAVTNLDLHDIARLARTYGIGGFFVVTPLQDQQQLVERLVNHWTRGAGGAYNPKRKQALEKITIRATIAAVIDDLTGDRGGGSGLLTVATSARNHDRCIDCSRLRQMLGENRPCLLMFGTAWGLADSVLEQADTILAPISGNTDYNHLSVRSAAAIILDRLARVDPAE